METQLVPHLADRQWGVVTRDQLRACGLGDTAIHARIADGRLRRLHRGVYAVGHRHLRIEGHWLAAVLAGGDGAVLSHASAGALWELRPTDASRVDVTVHGRGTRARTPGIRWHTSRRLDAGEITTHRGIPATTPARTILDLAETLTPRQLEQVRDRAQRLYLDAHVTPRRGRRGSPALGAVTHHQAGTTVTRSELEEAFLAFTRSSDLPTPRLNYVVAGHECDAVWPAHRLIVEVDSRAHHLTPEAFESDRSRDAALTAAGWRVIRVTHRRMAEDAATLRGQIARAISTSST